MKKTVKTTKKAINKGINTVGKKLGMNYFERRRFNKGVKNFAYDTGVSVASTLVIDGVETAAHITTKATCKVVSKGAEVVTNTVKNVSSKIKNLSNPAYVDDYMDEFDDLTEEAVEAVLKNDVEEDAEN